MKGFVVYPTYRVMNGNPFVCLFGRMENGQSFLTLNYCKPHFFIKTKDLKKVKGIESFDSEKTGLKNFGGEKITKIIVGLPKEVPPLRARFEEEGVECYEADIKFAYRFLFDNSISGGVNIEGEYESSDRIDRIYKEPKIASAEFAPKLKIAAIDIETDEKASEIYSISIVTKDYKTAIIRAGKKIDNAIICKSEEELLEKFKQKIIEIDPDVITGWSLIDFDLKTIFERCKEYSIPPDFGRDNTPCKLKFEEGFFRDSKADFPGRAVFDALPLIRASALSVKDYKLDTIAETVLGKRKSLQFKNKGKEIQNLFLSNPQKLADYNIQDSELVLEILEKSKVFDLALKKSMLSGLPIDRMKASIASLDSIYIKEARKRGLVVPSAKYNVKEKGIMGGYVKESEPGIYDYIVVLDFKSLYPSIIRTFNIDPSSYVEKCKGKNLIKAPNNACFRNEEGILPAIIQGLWGEREKARKEKDELARYAIKILMNSFFGVMASPSCRFFNLNIANAITHFGQFIIKLTAQRIEEEGYKVIYSDTDSVFIITKAKRMEEAEK
ncbi:hypothetical protein HY643_02175, partial [Candidatus Woesearchaeota archaeon]|nr:hypothetical protein [Candidatus Woesearchaeota archaeon]